MALFVDGPACTIDDLVAYDSGLLNVAQSEGINVTAKIQLAMEEITPEIELWLDRPRRAAGLQPPGLGHNSARVEQVVVTLALKRWQVMQALTMFYRDAYFSQLVDRFQAKWEEYSRLTRRAQEVLVSAGMAIVRDPVSRASSPLLSSVPASQGAGTYYAAISFVNAAGQEGAASEVASIDVADGHAMTITQRGITSMAWNVYAGTSLNGLLLQNERPLGPNDTWTYVAGAAVPPGFPPSTGQLPDYTMRLVRTMLRG